MISIVNNNNSNINNNNNNNNNKLHGCNKSLTNLTNMDVHFCFCFAFLIFLLNWLVFISYVIFVYFTIVLELI